MIENLWICINGIVPIFLLVGLGILLRKWNIADETFGQKATTVVFRLVLPVMIFQDIAAAEFETNFDGKAIGIVAVSIVLWFLLSWVLSRIVTPDDKKRAAFAQGAFRANYAILGFPLTKVIFGQAGLTNGPVILAMGMVLLNIFSVITLETFLGKKKGIRGTLTGIAKNPIIVSAVLGTAFNLSGLSIPTVLDKTITYVADMCVPLSLITVGISMQYKGFKDILPLSIGASLLKTLFLPLVFLPVAYLLGIRGDTLGALFVFWASPSAVAGYAMTRDMGGDYDLYGNIIIFSTLFSFFVIFFGVFILKNLGIV